MSFRDPLAHLSPQQKTIDIYDSPLSETGVLGFEYGYSLDAPDCLTLWEAQYGDFINAAQVIVDQFIASGEQKWHRLSALVLLLPHGFEGQGPEHSSARLERFLALSVDDNIQVTNPTTPAQYFHLLRRQALRRWAKPLVVMTPKSLLRHTRAVSSLDELATQTFRRVMADAQVDLTRAGRVLICCGKIYYDLLEAREKRQRNDVAIVRLEQLYPLRDEHLASALEGLTKDARLIWVQEEPENMGALRYLQARFSGGVLGRFPLELVARRASASPATGSHTTHKLEQQELIDKALDSSKPGA